MSKLYFYPLYRYYAAKNLFKNELNTDVEKTLHLVEVDLVGLFFCAD